MSSWWWLESWVCRVDPKFSSEPGVSPQTPAFRWCHSCWYQSTWTRISAWKPPFQQKHFESLIRLPSEKRRMGHPLSKQNMDKARQLCGGRNHIVVASSLRFLGEVWVPSVQIDHSPSTFNPPRDIPDIKVSLKWIRSEVFGDLMVVWWTIPKSTHGKLVVWDSRGTPKLIKGSQESKPPTQTTNWPLADQNIQQKLRMKKRMRFSHSSSTHYLEAFREMPWHQLYSMIQKRNSVEKQIKPSIYCIYIYIYIYICVEYGNVYTNINWCNQKSENLWWETRFEVTSNCWESSFFVFVRNKSKKNFHGRISRD